MAESHSEESIHIYSPVVELRQYTLHPGQRDVLINLFDREFIETQEAVGMSVIGQFRDIDDPNRFVWLRGFPDMPTRAEALSAFYGGPVWKAHREAANVTMIDSSNVLLLRPARPRSGFLLDNIRQPPPGATEVPNGIVEAAILYLDASADADFPGFFERALVPALTNTGASILAYFETEKSANNFPALPVREGENVFVWFSLFPNQATYEDHVAARAASQYWSDEISEALASRLNAPPEVLKLSPTARSWLHS